MFGENNKYFSQTNSPHFKEFTLCVECHLVVMKDFSDRRNGSTDIIADSVRDSYPDDPGCGVKGRERSDRKRVIHRVEANILFNYLTIHADSLKDS